MTESDGVKFGLLLGSTVGFCGALILFAMGALGLLALVNVLRRAPFRTYLIALAVALAWGTTTGWEVAGGIGVFATEKAWSLGLPGVRDLLLNMGPVVHVKLALMAAGLAAMRHVPRTRFIAALMVSAVALEFSGMLAGLHYKYQREVISLGVTLLATVGATAIFLDPHSEQLWTALARVMWLVVGMIGAFLGLKIAPHLAAATPVCIASGIVVALLSWYGLRWLLARRIVAEAAGRRGVRIIAAATGIAVVTCGVLSNTQFLWRPIEYSVRGQVFPTYRVEAGVVRSLRAMSKALPRTAVLAGTRPLVNRDWGRARRVGDPRRLRWMVYAALAERPVLGDSPHLGHGYGQLDDPAMLTAAEAVGRLFRCGSPAQARSIAGKLGVTHILLAPEQEYPWERCERWLRRHPVPGSLKLYEVIAGESASRGHTWPAATSHQGGRTQSRRGSGRHEQY